MHNAVARCALGCTLLGIALACSSDPDTTSKTDPDAAVPDTTGPTTTEPDAAASPDPGDAGQPERPIAVTDARPVETFAFSPSEADPEAVPWYQVQQLARFRRALDGEPLPVRAQLVVTLNGLQNPAGPSEVGDWLADRGFHTLTVDYRNTESVRLLDDSIQAYLEIADGGDHSPNVDVPERDSVFGRVEAALHFLAQLDPTADWGYYLDAEGHLRLERIIFYGYSFGSATATVIGKSYPVARVVAVAGPRYNIDVQATLDWVHGPSATAAERCYSILGALDPTFDEQVQLLDELGWPGELIDTTVVPAPYGGSHRLQTGEGHSTMCFGNARDDVCEYAFGVLGDADPQSDAG